MESLNPSMVIEDESQSIHALIPQLRSASRSLVREFGFMSSTFAATNLPPSAVHALIEIKSASSHSLSSDSANNQSVNGNKAKTRGVTASALCTSLNLEKSSVSRMLRKLIDSGEIEEGYSEFDGREKALSLTMKGKDTVRTVDRLSNEQVRKTLEVLPVYGNGNASPEMVLRGIEAYANAMRYVRLGEKRTEAIFSSEKMQEENSVLIKEGYIPGLIGRVVSMQMSIYSPLVNLGAFFESLLASSMADIVKRLDGTRAQVWTAIDTKGEIQGTLFIDTESKDLHTHSPDPASHSASPIALFRALVVDESQRGKGIGKILVEKAMKWVDGRRLECHLWTFRELEAARRAYDRNGFVVVEEGWNGMLGPELWMQRMVRPKKKGFGVDGFVF